MPCIDWYHPHTGSIPSTHSHLAHSAEVHKPRPPKHVLPPLHQLHTWHLPPFPAHPHPSTTRRSPVYSCDLCREYLRQPAGVYGIGLVARNGEGSEVR
jgi:hypothetical protein